MVKPFELVTLGRDSVTDKVALPHLLDTLHLVFDDRSGLIVNPVISELLSWHELGHHGIPGSNGFASHWSSLLVGVAASSG